MLARHLINRSRNRSQISLEAPQDSQGGRTYADSPLHSSSFPPHSAPSSRYDDREEDRDPDYGPPHRSEEANFYQSNQPIVPYPTRSYSTRSPSRINTNQPTIQLVRPHHSASTPSSAVDDNPDRYYQEGPPPPVHKSEIHKKKRSFFGLGSSSSSKEGGKSAPPKLGRSVSVRRKEEPQPPGGSHSARQSHWPTPEAPLADKESEHEVGLRTFRYENTVSGPPPSERDPLRSPAFPPPLTHEEYVQRKPKQQDRDQGNSNRYPLDRKGSNQSSWEPPQQSTKHSLNDSTLPTPSSANSSSTHSFAQRPPHESLHQYYHENSRPPSQQSLELFPSSQQSRLFDSTNIQGQNHVSSGYLHESMGPQPSQQSSTNRRSSESAQQSQAVSQVREGGGYHPYSQGAQPSQGLAPNAPPPQYTAQLAPQGQTHRANSQASPMTQQIAREPDGRNTPPPSRSRDDLSGLDVAQLLLRHDELRMSKFLQRYILCRFLRTC